MEEKRRPKTGEKITWGAFKQLVENQGVLDNDEIDLIDISWGKADKLKVRLDEDFGWKISL